MNSNVRNSDVLRRIRTYPSSPRRFDPHTASQEELLRHGLPRRPDPEKEPQLARLWKRVFARPVRFVEAKLAIDPVMSARDPLRASADKFGASGWAGVVKRMEQGSDFTQPATMVFGHWKLPFVPAISPNETIAVAFWVGLDGHASLDGPAATQVLQGGVAAQVNPPPWWWPWAGWSVKWWAWTEWFSLLHKDDDSAKAVAVENFPVAPGDQIFVTVYTPQPDFGFISMTNISRGIGVSVGVPAPSDIVAHGQSAEWIVEVPENSPHIPLFSPVTFSDCTAASPNGIFNLTGGFPTAIADPTDVNAWLTKTSIASPTIAVVEELGVDWF